MRPSTVPDTTPTRKENSVKGQVFIRLLPQRHLPLLPLSGSFRAPEFLPTLKRAVLFNLQLESRTVLATRPSLHYRCQNVQGEAPALVRCLSNDIFMRRKFNMVE